MAGLHLHGLDPRVVLGGQRVQDEVAVLVDAYQVPRLQLLRVHQPLPRSAELTKCHAVC